jgi:hypothetical protein
MGVGDLKGLQLSSTWQRLRMRSGRQALAAMVLLGVGFAIQPCVMAEVAEPDPQCPHCPPAETVHDQHCEGTAEPACQALDQLNTDGRSSLTDLLPALLPAPALAQITLPDQRFARPTPVCHQPGAPPLHVLHCVYLN